MRRKKLPYGKWQCPYCKSTLSDEINTCPVCALKVEHKTEIEEINKNYVESVYKARFNISEKRKKYLKEIRAIQKLAAEARVNPAKLKPYLVSKEESAENRKKLLKQLEDFK